jgi:hypothetical protein
VRRYAESLLTPGERRRGGRKRNPVFPNGEFDDLADVGVWG